MNKADNTKRGTEQSLALPQSAPHLASSPPFHPFNSPQPSHSHTPLCSHVLLSRPAGPSLSVPSQWDSMLIENQHKLQEDYAAGMKEIYANDKNQRVNDDAEMDAKILHARTVMEEMITRARAEKADADKKRMAATEAKTGKLSATLTTWGQAVATRIIQGKSSEGEEVNQEEIRKKLTVP